MFITVTDVTPAYDVDAPAFYAAICRYAAVMFFMSLAFSAEIDVIMLLFTARCCLITPCCHIRHADAAPLRCRCFLLMPVDATILR